MSTKTNTNTKEKVREKIEINIETPPDYRVVLLNNPVTAFQAVVDVLRSVFGRSGAEAEQIMFIAHTSGKASVIVSTREICEIKVNEAKEYCKKKEGETMMGRNAFYTALQFEVEEVE
jgi:ATP-dependent Clp protease adaptor protein ClpS